MQKIINIVDGIVRKPSWRMATPVNFTSYDGEQIAIVGPNGGGKTLFVNIITGSHPLLANEPEYDFRPSNKKHISDNIKYIQFHDAYGGDNDRTYYLQQRWNQTEIDTKTPTVAEKLDIAYRLSGDDTPERQSLRKQLYTTFGLYSLLEKRIILLSSGELRKLKIAEVLFSSPRILIIDNPFIGLDAEMRKQLCKLFTDIIEKKTLQLILVLPKTEEIPDFITHIVEVKNLKVGKKMTRDIFLASYNSTLSHAINDEKKAEIINLPYRKEINPPKTIVKLNQVSITYGKQSILKKLNWTILNGECWALRGNNGSGKSTLLSLICADNPQAYACNILLFDKPRGSGESIWEIKKKIGYVSPESHRAYQKDIPVIQIIASGFKDSIGLCTKANKQELATCLFWLNIFGIKDLKDKTFLELSCGEQRLVLLARAFVKDPQLLILDEPLHGLDSYNSRLVKDIINTFMQRKNKTLIMVTHYEEELPECINKELTLVKHS